MKMLRKHLSVLCAFIFMCTVLTGCWDEKDIGDIAPILSIGVDLNDNNQTMVYLTFPSAGTVQKQSRTGPKGNASVLISGTGVSLQAALDDAERRSSRRLFYPHNMLMIFSKHYAETVGIQDALSFTERSPYFRENQLIAISSESPKAIMESEATEEYITAYQLRQMISAAKKTLTSSQVDVVNQMLSPPETAVVAWLKHTEDTPSVEGAGIISGGKLVLYLPKRETDDLLWLVQHRSNEWVDFKTLRKNRTVLVITSQAATTFNKQTGQVTIHIRGFGQLAQIQKADKLDSNFLKRLNKQLNQEITARSMNIIQKLQEEGLDVFDVAKCIQTAYPNIWNKWRQHWPQIFSKMNIHVDSQIRIVRNGLAKNHIFDYGDNQRQGLTE